MAKKDDAGDEDLEGLQLSINEKSDETLECTRRMREMCAEAKDSGDVPSLCAPRPQHKYSTVQNSTKQYSTVHGLTQHNSDCMSDSLQRREISVMSHSVSCLGSERETCQLFSTVIFDIP